MSVAKTTLKADYVGGRCHVLEAWENARAVGGTKLSGGRCPCWRQTPWECVGGP